MQVKRLHEWNLTTKQATELQRQMAGEVSRVNHVSNPRLVAGVDMSANRTRQTATAAVVVLSFPDLELVETQVVEGKLEFPYVPGLLSFREIPLTLSACERLTNAPDLVIVDGQGIAHPRRMGLASHLGLCLDTPTIGCAKSLFIGTYEVPEQEAGSWSSIVDAGETVGAALRTKTAVKPVFVSIGHMVDLPSAIHWVLECRKGHRLPEPSRMAHLASKADHASKQDSKQSVKVPTLEDWAKAKERRHKKQENIPFIQKLRILDKMRQNAINTGHNE
ncbi:MAG: deoxyribonuclease V [Dehalococcoidia bacterium]|nr:deoxyribonuclease V [Dehalococcoidia bacterium]